METIRTVVSVGSDRQLKIGLPDTVKPGLLEQYLRQFLVGRVERSGTRRFCWVALSLHPTYERHFSFWRRYY